MKKKIAEIIVIGIILIFTLVFFIHWQARQGFKRELAKTRAPITDDTIIFDNGEWQLTQGEGKHILAHLKRRWADNCELKPTTEGWSCTEMITGEVFDIARR